MIKRPEEELADLADYMIGDEDSIKRDAVERAFDYITDLEADIRKLLDYITDLEAEPTTDEREEPTRERPHIEVLLAENGKLHSELRQVKREAKADSKRLDKLDSLAKFHGPRVNFYRTGPHMDGGTVVLQIMGQREVEGVDLRDAIDGWEEPHDE